MVTRAKPYGAKRAPSWATLVALARLGRFRFLAGGFVIYGLGAALARERGPLAVRPYVLGQAAITSIQLMTHYGNDYFDRGYDEGNRWRTPWSGGSGVLQEGVVPPELARNVAVGFGLVALVLTMLIAGTPHVARGTTALLLVALFLSWEYSAPPLRLHARGLGAFTAAIVVGGLTPLAAYGMQGAPWSSAVVLSLAPCGLAQCALVLALDLADAEADRRSGKRTLVVILGRAPASGLTAALVALVYAVLPAIVVAGARARLALGVAATAPAAAWLNWLLLRRARDTDRPSRRLTWSAVAWFALVGLAELAATASRVAA